VPDWSDDNSAEMPKEQRTDDRFGYEATRLDAVDREILKALQEDGRVAVAALGRKINLSAPSVAERLQRLRGSGVITGFRADVDPKALGYPIAAFVRIRPTTTRLQKIPELAREVPEVVECHRVTGEDCYVLKLHLRSMDTLEAILDRFIVFGQTTTSIIHSSPIDGRPLPVASVDDAAQG
jgi:Lrp/AsnC family leucine-responsive transcriptional regulator